MMFGVSQEPIILKNLPSAQMWYKIRQRNNDFAKVFIKTPDMFSAHYIEQLGNEEDGYTYLISASFASNTRG